MSARTSPPEKPAKPSSEKTVKSAKAEQTTSETTEAHVVDEIVSEVSRQISSILPPGQREQVIARVTAVVSQEAFRGPIAHPKHLEHYDKICPGAADRIIKMAEKEQEHRIAWVNGVHREETVDKRRGMYLGFGAFLAVVLAAAYCGKIDQPWLGGSFLATGVLSAVGLFINGRLRKQPSDNDEGE